MPGHGQLQIHQRLDVVAIDMEDSLGEEEQAEGRHDSDDPEHRRDPQHHAHIPGFGLVLVVDVVVGDGQDRAVV